MWSLLCVPYVGGGIYYSHRTVRTGHVVSAVCSVYVMVGYNIAIGLYVLVKWSALCIPLAIGLYVPDMWSVLCVPYVGGAI